MAKLFGFHFPVNFRRPYLAASITEFWRRWHISLSTWLRGGSRHGAAMTYRNLMLTMLLGGLWHAASWNFVIWGGYHGAWLGLERMAGIGRPDRRWYPIRALATFGIVLIGWVFFRAKDLPDSLYILRQMFIAAPGKVLLERWHWGLAAVSLVVAFAEEHFDASERLMRGPGWAYATALTALWFCIEIFGVVDVSIPFVYFQF